MTATGNVVEFPIERRGRIPRTIEQWIALLQRVQAKLAELGPGHVKITIRIEHVSPPRQPERRPAPYDEGRPVERYEDDL